jgi:hypothetical protein
MRLLIVAAAAALLLSSPTIASAQSAPGGVLIIHHRVADYAKWRPVYDADEPNRTAAGLTNCLVHKSLNDAHDLVIACDMADVGKAKQFGSAPRLRDTMKKAGVMGKPQLLYLSAAQ